MRLQRIRTKAKIMKLACGWFKIPKNTFWHEESSSILIAINFSFLISKVKVSGIKLAPFLTSTIVYFVVWSLEFFNSKVLSVVLKCIPAICLIAFIFFVGFKSAKEHRYQKFIKIGLVFSCIGDALLDDKTGKLFPIGMLAFSVTQICYIAAFGWKPIKIFIGVLLYAFGLFGELKKSQNFTNKINFSF